jgi:tungstate transport system substrate-binding protein
MFLCKKILFVVLGLFLLLAGCARQQPQPVTGGNVPQTPGELTLATTTSTYDSGLLDYLLPFFEEKYNYKVKVVSLGTGAALELGKNGDCDIVLVHARATELEMVKEGHYVDRRDVMYNDFVIVGPDADPAGLKSTSGVTSALLAVSETGSVFVSRGDDSGTHKKELSLWKKAGIEPAGDWYIKAGSGMGDTLRMTDEKQGYTLTDRATYLSLRDKIDLVIVFEGDKDLFNQYGIMAVNPDRHQKVNYDGATLMIEFFVSEEGQKLIAGFKPFGDTLFFPNAD